MDKITQVREEKIKFDLTVGDSIPEIFTDGVSHLVIGNPISKLIFHSVTEPVQSPNEIEQRQGVLRLVIPTPVLLEMCRNILFAAQSNIEAYSDGGKQLDAKFREIMNGVDIKGATVSVAAAKSTLKKPEAKK